MLFSGTFLKWIWRGIKALGFVRSVGNATAKKEGRIFVRDWRNTLENLLIVFVMLVAMNFLFIKPLRNDIKEITLYLGEKPTYSIQNDFDKMRNKGNGSIVLDLNNQVNHNELMPMDTVKIDSVQKAPFYKRWFRRKTLRER